MSLSAIFIGIEEGIITADHVQVQEDIAIKKVGIDTIDNQIDMVGTDQEVESMIEVIMDAIENILQEGCL